MPRRDLLLPLRSNPARYGYEGAARLVNCYAEEIGEEGRSRVAIYPVDGVADFAPIPGGSGGCRAMLEVGGYLYAVIGTTLYRVSSDGVTVDTVGGIATTGMVTMARNRKATTQIGVVSGGQYWIVTGTTLTQINDADLPPPVSISHLDGYFMLPIADGRIFYTAIDEGGTIDALDFIRAESNPDGNKRGFVRGRDFIAFGDYSTEFYNNTGGADSPFSRIATTDLGCLSGQSVASVEQTVAWVCNDGTVRVLDGYSGRRISTHAIERAIEDDPDRESIVAFGWQSRGHNFYAVNGSNFSRVYDASTDKWHDRESFGLNRWRAQHYANVAGTHILGDYELPKLYRASPDVFDDDGSPLVTTVVLPPVSSGARKTQHNAIYIETIPGVGNNDATKPWHADPILYLDYSEDGGRTWSAERALRLGKQGETQTRVRTHRLGISRANGRHYRIRCSAAVARAITGIEADIEVLGT